jgi:hypothetical protein
VLRETGQRKGLSEQTLRRFGGWAMNFVRFHDRRHPREMRAPEIGRFLEHVARQEREPLIAVEEARTALAFLYCPRNSPRFQTIRSEKTCHSGHILASGDTSPEAKAQKESNNT